MSRITAVAADLAAIPEPPTVCEAGCPSFSAVAERIDQLIARVQRLRNLTNEHEGSDPGALIQNSALLIEADLKRLLRLMELLSEESGTP